jgi:sortase A
MTVADQIVRSEPTEVAAGPSASPVPRASLGKRVFVISAGLLVIVLLGWGIYALFEGPGTTEWYKSRQRALAADFAAPHAHTGAGHAIALLQIPRINVNVVVAEGDSPQQLRSGPGHREGTAALGTLGNSVVLGHRDGWGGPFERLPQLHAGDLIAVQTPTPDGLSQTAVYRVLSTTRVAGNDTAPFVRSNDYRLTLVTGEGGRFSKDRVVVTAVSGKTKDVQAPAANTRATTSAGRITTNPSTVLALIAILGALGAWLFLRRRYHRAVAILVVAPLATLALIGALLSLDLFSAPLR